MARFIERDVAESTLADEPWSPGLIDLSLRLARERALDLLRRLYRAWLVATLQPTDARVLPRMTRKELHDLIDRARGSKGQPRDEEASRVLFELNAMVK